MSERVDASEHFGAFGAEEAEGEVWRADEARDGECSEVADVAIGEAEEEADAGDADAELVQLLDQFHGVAFTGGVTRLAWWWRVWCPAELGRCHSGLGDGR
jgi:hypothetical protein